jgi:hypothetical protein
VQHVSDACTGAGRCACGASEPNAACRRGKQVRKPVSSAAVVCAQYVVDNILAWCSDRLWGCCSIVQSCVPGISSH